MNTCKTCKYWSRGENENYDRDPNHMKVMGSCEKSDQDTGKDFFGAFGGGGYDSFSCGEDFGCINWEITPINL